MNREQWLTELAVKIEPLFDVPLPSYRVACSWPSKSATSAKNRRIGECWAAKCSEDDTTEIMLSMAIDDKLQVAETLVHEMCHAVVGVEHGHKAPFKRVALAIGLEGKMTATHAGTELSERLNDLIAELPEYPHAKINAANSGKKKQSTRMLKVVCECGYTVRMARKWAEVGLPLCGQCQVAMSESV